MMAGFWPVLHAEWTKFRTVRGWVTGLVLSAILMVALGVLLAGSVSIGCGNGTVQKTGRACLPRIPIGPGGEAVNDSYFFVHRSLAGNGTITAELAALHSDGSPTGTARVPAGGPGGPGSTLTTRLLVPWAKAGIMITASTRPGSAYAAMLVTGSHGVRMQYDYTGDLPGLPGRPSAASPRWLRLVRSGDTITGYDSAGGTSWTRVGTVALPDLPRTVQLGLFAASPSYFVTSKFFGGLSIRGGPTTTTAVITDVRVPAAAAAGPWHGTRIGQFRGPALAGGYHQAGGAFTVTGSGDIAPLVPGPGGGYPTATLEQNLVGAFAALIAIIAVASLFATAEYRRGLIRTTLAASPKRGQVLAAKALVAAAAAFVAGLVAAVLCILTGVPREQARGQFVLPVPVLTEIRVIAGLAAMLALVAVLAVCLGAILRRSAVTITAGIVGVVLCYLFAVIGVFPPGVGDWLLRLTPAAGFAIQQSIPAYRQVSSLYQPAGGYYPLPPWAGFGVLLAWTAAAFGLALYLLRRRDA